MWRAGLDGDATRLLQTLSPDEQLRAGRFRRDEDRARYVVARGTLRALLGRYLSREPDRLRFVYGPHGKPDLADDGGDLRFNLAHSGDVAVYAVARRRRVGVDVERIVPDRADQRIAERFFSPAEVAAFRALPRADQCDAFFACWARKEAFIKAVGEGLAFGLDQFEVSLAPADPPALLAVRGDPAEAARWTLRGLPAIAGYAAAVVAEGRDWHLSCLQFQY